MRYILSSEIILHTNDLSDVFDSPIWDPFIDFLEGGETISYIKHVELLLQIDFYCGKPRFGAVICAEFRYNRSEV